MNQAIRQATNRLLGPPAHQAIVLGAAQTQGSKKMVRHKQSGKMIMLEASDTQRSWREDVIKAMIQDRPTYPFDTAVEIRLVVYVHRPRSHYNKQMSLRPNQPLFPKSGKDQDKIQRAVGDAAKQAGWVFDDSRIAHWDSWRLWAELGEPERTVIAMRELNTLDAMDLGITAQKENLDKPLLAGL